MYCAVSHQSANSQWQKVDFLLEFAEWLYCNDLPMSDAKLQTQSAIDILLSSGLDNSQSDNNQGHSTNNTCKQYTCCECSRFLMYLWQNVCSLFKQVQSLYFSYV